MDDTWLEGLRNTTDRFRALEETVTPTPAPNQKPKTVKRPPSSYTTPSGATARSEKARNAYQRVQRKRG